MKATVFLIPIAVIAMSYTPAHAATPAELLETYRNDAAKAMPNFQPSAQRGAEFFARSVARHRQQPAHAGRITERLAPLFTLTLHGAILILFCESIAHYTALSTPECEVAPCPIQFRFAVPISDSVPIRCSDSELNRN